MGSSSNHDPSALWDWDSVLLLAHPLPVSDVVAGEEQLQLEENHSRPLPSGQGQRRRRDPRLTCPNYLAGRVPCACSDEEDEEEDDRFRKLAKSTARCQVPNCGADLAGLKGYHQRHRVCLACANAASVFVRNLNQRYCQQCGKFHPLPDFDEGKRSCRRKLERHNNRRRRKIADSGEILGTEPSIQSSDRDAPTNTTNNSDGNASDAGGFQALLEAPLNGGASGLRRLEPHPQPLQGTSSRLQQPAEDILSTGALSDGASLVREESFALDTSVATEQSLFALLLEESGDRDNLSRRTHSTEDQNQNQNQNALPDVEKRLHPSASSSGLRKRSTYTSPCPTRRISFKFYDWNPADFPRRLREQILEWLANMPVELEGYIRSGCTILTLFIAMPETVWMKLHEDWNGYLAKLVNGAESGFWDKGFVAAHLDNNVSYVDHGVVSSPPLCEKAKKKYPVLEGAFPICLEAGIKGRIAVLGQNLLELNSRLLIGSEGKYLPSCTSEDDCSRCCFGKTSYSSVQVDLVTPTRFGVVFIEVGYDHGISNFIPILIADRKLCEEVRTLEHDIEKSDIIDLCVSVYKQQDLYDMLLDLGWVIRHAQGPCATPDHLTKDSHLDRLQQLLMFSIQRGWCTVVERILQAAHNLGFLERVGIQQQGVTALELAVTYDKPDIVKVLLRYQNQVDGAASQDKKGSWLNVQFPGPRGLSSLHIAASGDGGAESVSVAALTRSQIGSLAWKCVEYARTLGRHQYEDNSKRFQNGVGVSGQEKVEKVVNHGFGVQLRCRNRRIVKAALGLVIACAGLCIVLQHSHRVVMDLSVSLRRCLWDRP